MRWERATFPSHLYGRREFSCREKSPHHLRRSLLQIEERLEGNLLGHIVRFVVGEGIIQIFDEHDHVDEDERNERDEEHALVVRIDAREDEAETEDERDDLHDGVGRRVEGCLADGVNARDHATDSRLLLLEADDEIGLREGLERSELHVQSAEARHELSRLLLLVEPSEDTVQQPGNTLEARTRLGRWLGLVERDAFIEEGFQAAGQFAGQFLTLLVVRQHAGDQEPHEEDIGGNDGPEERTEREKLPPVVMGDVFEDQDPEDNGDDPKRETKPG